MLLRSFSRARLPRNPSSSTSFLNAPSLPCIIGPSSNLFLPLPQYQPSRQLSTFPRASAAVARIKVKPRRDEEFLRKLERKRSVRKERKERDHERTLGERERAALKADETKGKVDIGQRVAEELPPLSERQLDEMYRGLIAAQPEELFPPPERLAPPVNLKLLEESGSAAVATSRRERLLRLQGRLDSLEAGEDVGQIEEEPEDSQSIGSALEESGLEDPYEVADVEVAVAENASLARDLLKRLERTLPAKNLSEERSQEVGGSLGIALGIVIKSEWRDLVLSLAHDGDHDAVGGALRLMQRFIPMTDGKVLSQILAIYSEKGQARDALKLIHFASENRLPLSLVAHHHLLTSLLPSHPILAIQHLHSLESAGHTPLLETYTLLIRHLVSPSSLPHLISRGWDLYAHTRLVSHPTPSVDLFSTMILACSQGPNPSPERAIDLFTEMTEDNNLPPSQEAYNGLIRSCARQVSKEYYFEALRFMRKMLDDNVVPNRKTLHSVLEGSRRHGDLARARWILVKMVQVGGEDIEPNEETLALVLQVYAAYHPPIKQGGKVASKAKAIDLPLESTAEGEDSTSIAPSNSATEVEDDSTISSTQDTLLELLGESSLMYPGPLPQTTDELLNEAFHLMAQCISPSILRPSTSSPNSTSTSLPTSMFPSINASSSVFLLNSYLLLLTKHGPFDNAVHFFREIYEEIGVEKNGFSFEIMMGRCETAKNREVGGRVGREVFEEWREGMKRGDVAGERGKGRMSGRNVSFMWASMIRILARNFQDLEALSLLQTFISTYPPTSLTSHARSSRASSQSLPTQPTPIRLSSSLYPETSPSFSTTDDRPPYLQFEDLKLLHLRLANVEDKKGLAVVKGICKAYEGALREAKDLEEGRASWRNQRRREQREERVTDREE